MVRRSPYSASTSSRIGAIIRHGGHHSAQKSTRTGRSDRSTSASKFSVVSTIISSLRGQHAAGAETCQLFGHLGTLPDQGVDLRVDLRELAPVHRDRLRAGAALLVTRP